MEDRSLLNSRVLLAARLLRTGLAFAFLYAAYGGFVDPASWVGFLPTWVGTFGQPQTLLLVSGIGEVALALWLLSGWQVSIAAALASCALLGIISMNLGQFPILFRDFSLAIAAVALAVLGRIEVKSEVPATPDA